MIGLFFAMGVFVVAVSWFWARGIAKEAEYRKQNPDYNPNEGWLDWDTAHTEGEIQ